MAKLTKAQARLHQDACNLLARPISSPLTPTEKEFILTHWDPSTNHINTIAGAFFTPLELAYDLALEVGNGSVIDLCAGIGTLTYALIQRRLMSTNHRLVCVEINLAYVEVGKRIIPEADWICCDVMDLPHGRGSFQLTDDLPYRLSLFNRPFDTAISNPPFGFPLNWHNKPLPGVPFDLTVLWVAATQAQNAVMILPQVSCPFEYSGRQGYTRRESRHFEKFRKAQVGIESISCSSIDCSMYQDKWKGVTPMVEIVTVDFTDQPEPEDEEEGGGGRIMGEEVDQNEQITLDEFEQEQAVGSGQGTGYSEPTNKGTSALDDPLPPPSLLSLTDISKLTGISYVTLRRYASVHDKELPGFGSGRTRKYTQDAVPMFKKYREDSKSGPKAGRSRQTQAAPATPAPTTPRVTAATKPVRGRKPGRKPSRPSKKGTAGSGPNPPSPFSRTSAVQESASADTPGQEIIRAMDRAVAEMERAQLVTQLETLRRVVGLIMVEVERLEKMVGMAKV